MAEIRAARDAALIEIDMIRQHMEKNLQRMGELIAKAERHVAELERERSGTAKVHVLQSIRTKP